jgi:hypothetical protein
MLKKEIVKSLLIIATVSSLCGLAGHFFNRSFLGIFLITTVTQFALGYLISAYTSYDFKKSAYLAELDKLEKLSTILNCAYCSHPNLVTFLPDTAPELVCDKCKNTSSVKLHFSVSRMTTPPTPVASILSEPQKTHNIKL